LISEELKSQIDAPLAAIPSGTSIMTAAHGEESTGMLASWVQQACFDPPMITAAVKKGRPIIPLVEGSGMFVVCPIGQEPKEMFRHFGRGFAPGEDAFSGIEAEKVSGGIVPSGCIGHLICEVRGQLEAGDHLLFLGEIIGGDGQVGAKPYVHVRKSGFSY
jgi:flavin reductase (DIM6/NTAB) family NADH-FMN oxidoreductase RutF